MEPSNCGRSTGTRRSAMSRRCPKDSCHRHELSSRHATSCSLHSTGRPCYCPSYCPSKSGPPILPADAAPSASRATMRRSISIPRTKTDCGSSLLPNLATDLGKPKADVERCGSSPCLGFRYEPPIANSCLKAAAVPIVPLPWLRANAQTHCFVPAGPRSSVHHARAQIQYCVPLPCYVRLGCRTMNSFATAESCDLPSAAMQQKRSV